jgi:hypothetical protein
MYERIHQRHGSNSARIAVARELLKIIYGMLKNNREFYVDLPGRLLNCHGLSTF